MSTHFNRNLFRSTEGDMLRSFELVFRIQSSGKSQECAQRIWGLRKHHPPKIAVGMSEDSEGIPQTVNTTPYQAETLKPKTCCADDTMTQF